MMIVSIGSTKSQPRRHVTTQVLPLFIYLFFGREEFRLLPINEWQKPAIQYTA